MPALPNKADERAAPGSCSPFRKRAAFGIDSRTGMTSALPISREIPRPPLGRPTPSSSSYYLLLLPTHPSSSSATQSVYTRGHCRHLSFYLFQYYVQLIHTNSHAALGPANGAFTKEKNNQRKKGIAGYGALVIMSCEGGEEGRELILGHGSVRRFPRDVYVSG